MNDLEILWIHEALTNKVRAAKNTEESSVQGMTKLLDEFNKIRILLRPS